MRTSYDGPGFTSPNHSPSPKHSPMPPKARTGAPRAHLKKDAHKRELKEASVQERLDAERDFQLAEQRRMESASHLRAETANTRRSMEQQARSAAVQMFDEMRYEPFEERRSEAMAKYLERARTPESSYSGRSPPQSKGTQRAPRADFSPSPERPSIQPPSPGRGGGAQREVDALRNELKKEREEANRLRADLSRMQSVHAAVTPHRTGNRSDSRTRRDIGSAPGTSPRPKSTAETSKPMGQSYKAYSGPMDGDVQINETGQRSGAEVSGAGDGSKPQRRVEQSSMPPQSPPRSPKESLDRGSEPSMTDLTGDYDGVDFDKRIARLKETFNRIDEKKQGFLGKKQMYDHIRRSPQLIELFEFSPKPSDGELNILFGRLDADGSNTIDFNEFCEEFLELPEDTFWRVMGDHDKPLKGGGLRSPFRR